MWGKTASSAVIVGVVALLIVAGVAAPSQGQTSEIQVWQDAGHTQPIASGAHIALPYSEAGAEFKSSLHVFVLVTNSALDDPNEPVIFYVDQGPGMWELVSNPHEYSGPGLENWFSAPLPPASSTPQSAQVRITYPARNLEFSFTVDFTGGGAPPPPPGENQAPSVSLSFTPAIVTPNDILRVHAAASDPDGDALTYTWYLNGSKQTSATSDSVRIDNPPLGTYNIRVVVSDGKGGTDEDTVIVTVGGQQNNPPIVTLSITSQTASRIEFFAQASDPDGDELMYEWYLNGEKTSSSKPKVFWNDPPKGSHTLRVVVSDGKGGSAEDTVSFTVNNQQNSPPMVTLSITSETIFQIKLSAQASDPDGDELSYEWYRDGVKVNTTQPNVVWNDPPMGTHTVRVVVSDGQGGVNSDTVTFVSQRYVMSPGPATKGGGHQAFIKRLMVDGKEVPSEENKLFYVGGWITTGHGVEVELEFSTGATLRVEENSHFEISEPKIKTDSRKVVYTRLIMGIINFYWPPGHEAAEKFEVATERAVTSIKGTRLTISHLDGVTTVEVQEGEVEVTDLVTNAVSTVSAGHSASFGGSEPTGSSIEAALDVNANGVLDDGEIRQAVLYWVTGQTVPGTGSTISDAKITELVQMWIMGTPLAASATPTPMSVPVRLSAPSPLTREVEVAGAQGVGLALYDLSGRLLCRYQTPGPRLRFSLHTPDGAPLANGVYLYVVSARQAADTWRSPVRKLVVLR